MSTDLDDLIRTTLAERAEDAPSAGRVIARAPRPVAARRATVRRRWPRGLAAAGLVGALAVTGAVLAPRLLPSETRFEPAMSFAYDGTPRSAEAYRLVLDAPGWAVPGFDGSVTDATHIGGVDYEPAPPGGERRPPRLDIGWGDGSTYQEALRFAGSFDTGDDGVTELPIEVLGQAATYWSNPDKNAFRVVLPLTAGHYQQITGTAMTKADFEGLLTQLRWVDQAGFDTALPDRYLTAQERPATIERLLTGVPLPQVHDAARITSLQPNRYHLAIDVAKGAVCAWYDEWQAATAADDDSRISAAEEALAGARTWPLRQEFVGEDAAHLLPDAPTVLGEPGGNPDSPRGPEVYGCA